MVRHIRGLRGTFAGGEIECRSEARDRLACGQLYRENCKSVAENRV
jgi:hypothetical protein